MAELSTANVQFSETVLSWNTALALWTSVVTGGERRKGREE